MTQQNVEIATQDGSSPASLHIPEGDGPWPAVIMYPDAGGLRDAIRGMADHLASLGYVTLVPDVYYRAGDWAPFDMGNAFRNEAELKRMMGLLQSVSNEMAVNDAQFYIDFLLSLAEVSGDSVGTTGYCMGGRLSLVVAGHLGDQVAAAASFHGGNIAAADDPSSPHLRAKEITAAVYVAGATDDASFPEEQKRRLEEALSSAGVKHTIETYPAAHGFAVPDNPTYDEAAASRHWDALVSLYGGAFQPAG